MNDGNRWKWKNIQLELCLTRKEYDAMPLFPKDSSLDEVVAEVECDQRYRLISEAHDQPMVCWINYREPGAVKWAVVQIVEPERAKRRDRFDPRNWGIT